MTDAKAAAASQAVPRWTLHPDIVGKFAEVRDENSRLVCFSTKDICERIVDRVNAGERVLPASGQAAKCPDCGHSLENQPARLRRSAIVVQAGWDLTDSADRRYGERRISELECQADAPPVEAVGQQGADATIERLHELAANWEGAQYSDMQPLTGEMISVYLDCANQLEAALKGTPFAGDAAQPSAPAERDVPAPIVITETPPMVDERFKRIYLDGERDVPALTLEQVRAVLLSHIYDTEIGVCPCDPDTDAVMTGKQWVEHILALLAAPETEKR